MTKKDELISYDELQQFIKASFEAVGLPAKDADKTACLMARADLMDQDGHGVLRLPQYIKRIRDGGLNVAPHTPG